MRYSLLISDTINIATLIAAIQAIDPHATIVADPQLSEVEKLCDIIRTDAKFETGFINANTIDQIIESDLPVELKVTDQVRIGVADLYLKTALQQLLYGEDDTDMYRVVDAWSWHVNNNLLYEMGDILLLVLFGTKPDQSVIDAMRECKVKCAHMDEDDQRAIFTDYAQFVNDTLNRAQSKYDISFQVFKGYD